MSARQAPVALFWMSRRPQQPAGGRGMGHDSRVSRQEQGRHTHPHATNTLYTSSALTRAASSRCTPHTHTATAAAATAADPYCSHLERLDAGCLLVVHNLAGEVLGGLLPRHICTAQVGHPSKEGIGKDSREMNDNRIQKLPQRWVHFTLGLAVLELLAGAEEQLRAHTAQQPPHGNCGRRSSLRRQREWRWQTRPHPPWTNTAGAPSVCGWKIWLAASLRYLPTSLTSERVRTDITRGAARKVLTPRGAGVARQGATGRAVAAIACMAARGCVPGQVAGRAERRGEAWRLSEVDSDSVGLCRQWQRTAGSPGAANPALPTLPGQAREGGEGPSRWAGRAEQAQLACCCGVVLSG